MSLIAQVKIGFKGLSARSDIVEAALVSIEKWLSDESLSEYRPYIEYLIKQEQFSVLLDSFWRMIPFGTGGRRGPVGAGPNRVNPHTIKLSVQGHCDYLRDLFGPDEETVVVLAYDVRCYTDQRGIYGGQKGILDGLTSRQMARASAQTYAANGVVAYLIGPLDESADAGEAEERYISTPELSFLVRALSAQGGLNISASHNHPDDNGGKFYNRHGGQEVPPHDEVLLKSVEQVEQVKTMTFSAALDQGLVRAIPRALHEEYISLNIAFCGTDSRAAKIAFSPLCGTGKNTVGEAFKQLGFSVYQVPSQADFDGSFASVRYRIANPEVPETMDKLEAVARENGCEVGFATDPDADRLGVIVDDGSGGYLPVKGNDIGVLLLESLLGDRRRTDTMPEQPIFITTLVSTTLMSRIARRYGCQVIGDLMVGFKYMGDVLMHLEESGCFPPAGGTGERDAVTGGLEDFIFTCEESHGYLLSPRVRDKDACGAAVHLAGLACRLKDENNSILNMLRDIYRVYGYHSNQLRSLVMEGIVGLERIGRIQDRLRAEPPEKIAGKKVLRFIDNQKVGGPLKSETDRASRNVLFFEIEQDADRTSRVIIRPSGTEPKTKYMWRCRPLPRFQGRLPTRESPI
jgi:phosphoglucomutase